MKKTFTINISGTVFHIEEDAYEVLQKYLINLKTHFGSSEEGKEILTDIEARIAEIFIEKATNDQRVVSIEMVNVAIEIMGTPEDFVDDEEKEEVYQPTEEAKRKRRLYRDPDHRVIGGVCGGLGAYFNMDPVILRIIFVVLLFATSGAGFLAYIILWIAVPKAKNTAQRLEMRGQEATVKNIEKSIKEEVSEMKESYKKFKESDTYSKGRKSVDAAGDVTYNFFKVLLKVFVIIIGVFLIISGFIGLLGFISSMVIGHSFVQGWPLIWSPEVQVPGFLNHFVAPGTVTFGMIAVGLLAGIPLLAMLFIGTKLVFRYKTNNTAIGLTMVGIWLIALVSLIGVSIGQLGNYKNQSSVTETKTISCDSCQTLILKLGEDKYENYAKMDFEIDNVKMAMVDGEEVLLGNVSLDVERSGNDDFTILIKKSSRGKTRETAKEIIEKITYRFDVKDSTVVFDPWFILGEDEKYRGQDVDITVKVPQGKAVFLSNGLERIIDDIENVSNTWDGDMVGKTWIMKPEGLTMKEE
ncbi:MAG TPA: PspC domain-containing protein [Draconibacterium sp.]|nr:PspC domain-containing protein [Draconibacterium sp.]